MSDHTQVMDVLVPDGGAWLAIGIAFVAYFFVSFLWWGPIFGKKWAVEMGMDPDMKGDGAAMGKGMALQAVGTFLLAYVLWHVMMAFTVALEGGEMVLMKPDVMTALFGGFMTWLGFFVPVQLGRIAWENASWRLVGINAGGQLVALEAMVVVFALV